MPLFWSEKRTTVEWLAAPLRDMAMMPPDKAMQVNAPTVGALVVD
jgi:hypothetical protein